MCKMIIFEKGRLYTQEELDFLGVSFLENGHGNSQVWGSNENRYIMFPEGDCLKFMSQYMVMNSSQQPVERLVPK